MSEKIEQQKKLAKAIFMFFGTQASDDLCRAFSEYMDLQGFNKEADEKEKARLEGRCFEIAGEFLKKMVDQP